MHLLYIDQWALWLNLGIYLWNVPVVLFAHGAKEPLFLIPKPLNKKSLFGINRKGILGPHLLFLTNQKGKKGFPVFLFLSRHFIVSFSIGVSRLFLASGRKDLRKSELLTNEF